MKILAFFLLSFSLGLGAPGDAFVKQGQRFYETKDYDEAKSYYQKACDMGNMLGCSGIGMLYENGFGVERDYKKAKQYFDFACKNHDSFGCFQTRLLEIGPKAEKYYQALCDEDEDGIGCQRLADLYYKELGVNKNLQNAAFYYQRACALLVPEACFNLAIMYERGQGKLKKNLEIALAYFYLARNYFEKECQEGQESSCKILHSINMVQD
ncbi:tetratricopeptide repeat protein [Helicobacter mustelae]|uniref:Beta-lactamase n=1 Tax=Helicobacter mustelae (strain ATCC 43772 / CCUG 25715 / CIP 103759 / LMG 18044 / NCTC 12198 / R85-136P) TaxID=679897 RepID=D3UGB1_HELM1|nr:tetratricopeptide repeat protein [Helicobacter mustelae]CBG39532.1 putative hypothetical protein [Helicobacter mustelae 12198]SQH71044.1 cysteine-rich protein H [Helicobacter mustelae]